MTRARESVSSPQSAHMENHSVETHRERKKTHLRKAPSAQTAPIRHLCQVKTLTTSVCLKHYEFHKTDNGTEMCQTADAK